MSGETYPNASILIEPAELEAQLGQDDLRIIDAHVFLNPKPGGGYDLGKGDAAYAERHIPGAVFIDLIEELSAPHPSLLFMMPGATQFERVMSAHGIGNAHRIVVYSAGPNMFGTRLYFMLKAMGHEKVQVLNGGFDAWLAEGRPTSDVAPRYTPSVYRANPQAGIIVNKPEIVAALGKRDICLLNALNADSHRGDQQSYRRTGHIPGSKNVPALGLIDPQTKKFAPASVLAEKLGAVGATQAPQVIAYCGGGISATTDGFALLLLGHRQVAIYDGSMSEWVADESLPIETGP
jgi:thiosulfate/3-mercaptopyruvate sulfurtransferase